MGPVNAEAIERKLKDSWALETTKGSLVEE